MSVDFFFDPAEASGGQLLFLTLVYGYVLFTASGLISDGSELLLLVPWLAGIVGSVVLPILGAVPDGMMVFFSCLGDNVEDEIAVGVGALAGSTIMLLTVPWFLAILGGRVNIVDGKPTYARPAREELEAWRKFDPERATWLNSGCGVGPAILANSKLMMATALIYLIIQVPVIVMGHSAYAVSETRIWALGGAAVCMVALGWYLYLQVRASSKSSKLTEARVTAIYSGALSLRGAMANVIAHHTVDGNSSKGLISDVPLQEMKKVLAPFFAHYDVNNDMVIDRQELYPVMRDLNENVSTSELNEMFEAADKNQSNSIDFEEFSLMMLNYVMTPLRRTPRAGRSYSRVGSKHVVEEEDEGEEEEDVPSDLLDLTPEEQQFRIKMRAAWMMGLGTLLVVIFSDPAVSVLSEIGVRTGIPAFYISFVLAPMASNSAELIAAYSYAQKKTQKTMTIALSALEGAAIMNNTYCLGIFLLMIGLRGLEWKFLAETCSIVFVQMIMGAMAMRSVFTVQDGYRILCIYPTSLFLVWFLQSVLGWQ